MPHTTLILSDTHLGRPKRATAEGLRPLWQGVDELVINGDAAEVQIPWLRSAAAREIDRLDQLTHQDGVRLTLVSGNHDAYLTDTRCLERAGGAILIMHGDALHPGVAPWTRSGKAMQAITDRALAEVPDEQRDCLHTRLAIAQHVGHSEFIEEYVLSSRGESGLLHKLLHPWEIPPVLAYWRSEPGLAHAFLERYAPKAQVLIVGHSHHPGVWRRGGRTIINTGAFMFPDRPWCAVIQDQTIRVERIKKREGLYERRPKPVTTVDLQPNDQDASPAPETKPQAGPGEAA